MIPVAIASYLLIQPGLVAQTFAEHVNAGRFNEASQMMQGESDMSFFWTMLKDQSNEKHREISASIQPGHISDVFRLTRFIEVESMTNEVNNVSLQVSFQSTMSGIKVIVLQK